MRRKLQNRIMQRLRQNRRSRNQQVLISALSILVLCGTLSALIIPAITMEQETFCGVEAHAHTEECFGEPICQTETSGMHTHSEECFAESKVLTCQLPEQTGHTHSPECETTVQTLICALEEGPEHSHGESCYTAESSRTCGQEEAEAHAHGEECYTVQQTTVCGLEETVPETHVHTESCYPEEPICGLVEHEHQLICYSDPEADLETAAHWEKTLPGTLTEVWAEDLAAIARSQLGYQESSRNYTVEAEEKSGYTRYGAWAGTPYAPWNQLFVAFCLEYAGVPQESFPRNSDSQLWLEALSATEQLAASDHLPIPGDLVFLDTDGQPGADRVGIVATVSDDGTSMEVIEGDRDGSVQSIPYSSTDAAILGYGIVPENPALLPKEYTVWIDATNGGNPYYGGSQLPNYSQTVTEGTSITLPTGIDENGEWINPDGYEYILRGWYAITGKEDLTDAEGNVTPQQRYYNPGDTVTVTANTVFYADWVPESYEFGHKDSDYIESSSTSDFVTVKLFDYNDLVNINAAVLNNSRAKGDDRETWTALSPSVSGILPLNTWRQAGNTLDCPAYSQLNGESLGIYRGDGARIAENLYSYAKDYYFTDGNLGVNYVGKGDYLFQYDDKGYYHFDSHKYGATYMQSQQRFYIYTAPYVSTCNGSLGDFMPFNYDYNGGNTVNFDHDGTVSNEMWDANYWFGMTVDIDFTLLGTPGGDDSEKNKAAYGNDMVFEFAGDDDVWVFVDGVLVLDMGGLHEAVEGSINFSTGEAKTKDQDGVQMSTTLDQLIPGFSSGDHKITMYYMERGGGLSNCAITFNLAARQNLQLNKLDRQHPDTVMDGTVFEVFLDEACTIPATDLFRDADKTDSSNTFTIGTDNRDILYGFYCKTPYYIKETKAPAGYEPADRVLKVEFDFDGTMTATPLPENTLPGYDGNVYAFVNDDNTNDDHLGIVTVYNAKTTDALTLKKIWYRADGSVDTEKSDPVTVDLYRTTKENASMEDLTEVYKTVTISDGDHGVLTAVLEDVERYDPDKHLYYYYIVEHPVDGYAAAYIRNGSITGGTITVTNAPQTPVEYEQPDFTLTKKDDAGNLLSGAIFRLWEYSSITGDYIWEGDYTVGSSGTIDFSGKLDYNTAYYIQELQAPEGYLKNPNPIYLGIKHSDTALYPVTAPAGFTWTDADGQEPFGIEVVNFGNPAIQLEKVDSADHNIKLPGAKFSLYRWNGTGWVLVHSDLTTDDAGKLKLNDLDYNTVYKISETTAPDGYFLKDQHYVFQIPAPEGYGFAETVLPGDVAVQSLRGGAVIQAENEKMPEVTLKKVNQDGTVTLPGAEFTLSFYANGNWKEIQSNIVTDTEGNFLLDKLSYDTLYRLQETKAPEGYLADSEYHYFWIRSSADSVPTVPDVLKDTSVTAFGPGPGTYSLTVSNTKIPDLSIRKEWFDENGQIIADPSGYDAVHYTLYRAKVYTVNTDNYLTITYNMGQWYHDSSIYGTSDPFPSGSTVTMTVSAKDMEKSAAPEFYHLDPYGNKGNSIPYTVTQETDLGNNRVDRIYSLVLENISEDVRIGGKLIAAVSCWSSPTFTLPAASSVPTPEPEALVNGTLSQLNEWTAPYYGELKAAELETLGNVVYNVSYAYYVTENPVPEGYHPEYRNNGLTAEALLALPHEDRTIVIQNKPGSAAENFTLLKIDKATGEALSGVPFRLTRFNGTDYVDEILLTTNAQGEAALENLFCDVLYQLEELSAPEGYDALSEPVWFWIQEEADAPSVPTDFDISLLNTFEFGESAYTLTVHNSKTPNFYVEKQWQNADGSQIANTENFAPVYFEVYERAVKAAATENFTATLNVDDWSIDGNGSRGSVKADNIFPGSTLTVTIRRTVVSDWQGSPKLRIRGTTDVEWDLSSAFSAAGVYQGTLSAEGADCPYTVTTTADGSTYSYEYRISIPVHTSLKINFQLTVGTLGDLSSSLSTTPPENSGDDSVISETLAGTGVITYEDGWKVGCSAELKENTTVIEDDGKEYSISYTYHVRETSRIPGYTTSISGNGLSAAELKKRIVTIINQRNDLALTELQISKVDADDASIMLPGAKFDLYAWNADADDWTILYEDAETDQNGIRVFSNLSYNTAYKLVETQAPSGYQISGSPWHFFFGQEDTDTYPVSRPDTDIAYSNAASVEIANEKRVASLTVKKQWLDLEGNPSVPDGIQKITFELHRKAQTADGTLIDLDYSLCGSFTIRKNDGWTLDIYDLPAEGILEIDGVSTPVSYVYYVTELPISFFSTTYSGNNALPNSGASIVITNTEIPTYELPETGGSAASLYVLGCLLTSGAALAFGKKRRIRS